MASATAPWRGVAGGALGREQVEPRRFSGPPGFGIPRFAGAVLSGHWPDARLPQRLEICTLCFPSRFCLCTESAARFPCTLPSRFAGAARPRSPGSSWNAESRLPGLEFSRQITDNHFLSLNLLVMGAWIPPGDAQPSREKEKKTPRACHTTPPRCVFNRSRLDSSAGQSIYFIGSTR